MSLRPSVCIAAENMYLERVIYSVSPPDAGAVGGSWFKKKSPPSNLLNSHVIDITYISMESSYFIELFSARKAITQCAGACKCWSSTYDNCTVSKDHSVSTAYSNHSNIHRHESTTSRVVGYNKKHRSSSGIQFNTKAGVFVKLLLEKLSRMLGQPPNVNLLLTKLISRLCHYPHPLLTSFLLHHNVTLVQAVPDLPLVSAVSYSVL